MTIKLDFHAGTHGHFLEYVSNVYIMGVPSIDSSIFNETGASHCRTRQFQTTKIITCGHYSKDNIKFTELDTVIRIDIDTQNDKLFFIAFSNLLYRAGRGYNKQLESVPYNIRKARSSLRCDLYSKFNEREIYVNEFRGFSPVAKEFKFPFGSFFSYDDFCDSLQELSDYLGKNFKPDISLHNLWNEFINKNQGYLSFNKCELILDKIVKNKDHLIECTVVEEAWINYNLTKRCGVFNGPLFSLEQYPGNCRDIYKIIN